MIGFLLDEMFLPPAATLLRESYGRDAVVAATARSDGRAAVTENVSDFAAERDVVVVFVLKKNLLAGGAQAAALAKVLDRWTHDQPDDPCKYCADGRTCQTRHGV